MTRWAACCSAAEDDRIIEHRIMRRRERPRVRAGLDQVGRRATDGPQWVAVREHPISIILCFMILSLPRLEKRALHQFVEEGAEEVLELGGLLPCVFELLVNNSKIGCFCRWGRTR